MLLKWNFGICKRSINFLFRITKEKTVLQYGFGNRCKGTGEYLLFIDYDNPTPYDWVIEEIGLLQRMFMHEIGRAYLFKTKHGYHVVFLEKLTLGRVIEMLDVTSCDKQYRTIPMMYGRKIWVLRQSLKKDEEIKYLGFHEAFSMAERSRAHALYLQQYCIVPRKDITGNGKLDFQTELTMGYYKVNERNN